MQIVQTSIWTTISTFKGQRRGSVRGDLQKYDKRRAVNCKITQSPHAPWMLIWCPKLKFARFASDMFPKLVCV